MSVAIQKRQSDLLVPLEGNFPRKITREKALTSNLDLRVDFFCIPSCGTYPLGWTDNIDGTSRAYQIGFIAGHDSRYKEQYLDGIHWDVKMWCQFFMKRMETAKKQEAKKTKEARPGESTK
jgi:hypothetical protein